MTGGHAPPQPVPHPGRQGLPVWAWALILGFGLLAVTAAAGISWLLSAGMDVFKDQARTALQEDAVVARHIGEIRVIETDLMRTGALPGAEDFAFRLEGSLGKGRVEARFISTFGSEILGKGTLYLDDGRTFPLPGDAD